MDRMSTLNLRSTLAPALGRAQTRLAVAQSEMGTGRMADPGRALGAHAVNLHQLNAMRAELASARDANGLEGTRLSAMQGSLEGMVALTTQLAGSMASALTSASAANLGLAADVAEGLRASAIDHANVKVGGQHVFGGVRSGEPPLADPEREAGARDAILNAFTAHFGHPPDDPASLSIDEAGMAGFLDALEADFPNLYALHWAGDAPAERTARIAPGMNVDVPVTHHDRGMRDLVLATSIATTLVEAPFGGEARGAMLERVIGIAGRAGSALTEAAGRLGSVEARVESINGAMRARAAVIDRALAETVGVDPFEAATRVQSLSTQIEASLAVTARVGRLSLLNFL